MKKNDREIYITLTHSTSIHDYLDTEDIVVEKVNPGFHEAYISVEEGDQANYPIRKSTI